MEGGQRKSKGNHHLAWRRVEWSGLTCTVGREYWRELQGEWETVHNHPLNEPLRTERTVSQESKLLCCKNPVFRSKSPEADFQYLVWKEHQETIPRSAEEGAETHVREGVSCLKEEQQLSIELEGEGSQHWLKGARDHPSDYLERTAPMLQPSSCPLPTSLPEILTLKMTLYKLIPLRTLLSKRPQRANQDGGDTQHWDVWGTNMKDWF